MGYYLRVLSTSKECVSISKLKSVLKEARSTATITNIQGDESWTEFLLEAEDGSAIAQFTRDEVSEDSFASEELEEFIEELSECEPRSGAIWVCEYLEKVKCIYAVQLLMDDTDDEDCWESMELIRAAIAAEHPSIGQADGEGFRNEQGYHVVWQFDDSAQGDWAMAVLQDGRWRVFGMDLGNPEQRKAFLNGQVPSGVDSAEL